MAPAAGRPGEIVSLQWRDVSLGRHELVFRAEKSKTRTERIVPISTRLLATLEMRKLDPAGEPFAKDAYVFGDELGRRVKSVRTASERDRAGLTGLQLRDLRSRGGVTAQGSRSPGHVGEQNPWAHEPDHDEPLPRRPPPRASRSDGQAGSSPPRRCTTIAQKSRGHAQGRLSPHPTRQRQREPIQLAMT